MESIRAKHFAFFVSVCGLVILLAIHKFDFEIDGFKMRQSMWSNMSAENYSTLIQTPKMVVLVYTKFFRARNWVRDGGGCSLLSNQRNGMSKKCSLNHFELTYDKTRFFESDLVVFHVRNMPSLDELKSLSNYSRPISQRWVYALWESPKASRHKQTPYNGLFNLTWTYRTDSDIWGPYGRYEQLSPEEINISKLTTTTDYSQGKTELVAWMASNCRSGLRISLVHELKKYIKVDVFGHCSDKIFGEPRLCPRNPEKTSECLKKYKFYLSFENVLCEDYITEKYWGHLGNENVVPVVMGGANYTKLAVPGSYINVMDFKTVKQLSEYLQYLDKNNTAYNEYFNWRLKYKVTDSLSISLCEICRAFDTEHPPKSKIYDDLKAYWVTDARCNQKYYQVKNMWSS